MILQGLRITRRSNVIEHMLLHFIEPLLSTGPTLKLSKQSRPSLAQTTDCQAHRVWIWLRSHLPALSSALLESNSSEVPGNAADFRILTRKWEPGESKLIKLCSSTGLFHLWWLAEFKPALRQASGSRQKELLISKPAVENHLLCSLVLI